MMNDPIMAVINKNLSYKEKREVIAIMSESYVLKEQVYGNIGKYFMNKITALRPTITLNKYLASNGNITKLKGYDEMDQSLNILSRSENPEVSRCAMEVKETLFQLNKRQRSFELGCKTKDSMIAKFIYGTMAKMCHATTSLLIANDDPEMSSKFSVSGSVAMGGIRTFNTYAKDGTIDKVLRYDLNTSGKFVKEDLLSTPFDVLATIGSVFITAIRSAVYWVYYTRMDLAEYLEHQAAYLEQNKLRVQNRTDLTPDQKKEIIRKQEEWRKKLLDYADKVQIDEIKAARKAKEKAKQDEKDMTGKDATAGNSGSSEPDFF